MNQNVTAAQVPNGPLTWIWYLVVFAVMTTLGSKTAGAVLGHGAFQAALGTAGGIIFAAGLAWLWRQIPSLIARLILGALFLIVAAVSALVAEAILESHEDYAAEAVPAQMAEEGPWTQYQQPAPPIDTNKVVWDQPVMQQQFSQAEIDRANASLQAQNESIEVAKAVGRAAAEAYEDEQRRR